MTTRAKSLNEWRNDVPRDHARYRNFVQMWQSNEVLMSEGGPLTIKQLSETDWATHYRAAHADDRLVYDMAHAYAALRMVAESDAQEDERRGEARALAERISRSDPFDLREFLPAIMGFLFPASVFLETPADLVAREIVQTEADVSSLERVSDLVAETRDQRNQSANEARAFTRYVEAIWNGDGRARSVHYWSWHGPRDVLRLYAGGPKTIRRRISERIRGLPPERQQALKKRQEEIFRRETRRPPRG
jgi:hypothetical protein